MAPRLLFAFLLLVLPACRSSDASAEPSLTASLDTRVRGMQRVAGLLDLYLDRGDEKLWLRLPPADERGVLGEYLYPEGLASGLGSNPVGLDRGRLGATRVVVFERRGPRIVLAEPNLAFRAVSRNAAERRFGKTVIAGNRVVRR